MKDKHGNQLKESQAIKYKGQPCLLSHIAVFGVCTWAIITGEGESELISNIDPSDIEIIED